MQVTCPNCRARYAVDPQAIGPGGRMVQCVRCSHCWFERSPDLVLGPETSHAAASPRTKPQWGRWIGAFAIVVIVAGAAAFAYREELQTRLPGAWHSILSFGLVRGILASPAEATVASPGEPRVELDLAASKIEWKEDRYVLRGELINTGQVPGSTAVLKLVFRNGDDVLDERFYPLIEGPIAPGARRPFTRMLGDPPDGATNVVPVVE
jgi:predicted Zn finger-like uncharacterized protein